MMTDRLRGVHGAAVGLCMLFALPSSAAVITVTSATFGAAVAAEHNGDTLRLVGAFGREELLNRSYATPFTIDATHATFTSPFTLNNVTNVTVLGGTFDIVGAPQYTRAIQIYGGRNVTISGVTVVGSAGGEGVVFDGTRGATLTNSSFRGLQVAAVIGSVTGGTVTHNTVTGAVSDGIDIANSHSVTAAYNGCSGSTPGPGVHPDCIQLWSITHAPLQSDIIVRNNTATGATQGFTAFDSMGGELRVQIVHNSVDTSYPQGIACYGCIDSSISYNSIATLPGAAHETSLSVVGGSNNQVIGNLVRAFRPDAVTNDFIAASDAVMIAADVPPNLSTLTGTGFDGTLAAVPETSVWAMLIAGFGVVGVARRRAARAASRRLLA